ncbi:hypothetical protein PIROE2DRAFT_60734 [Piromyces sp. E2]|nr:hypothetical protein PIROE2DRAFT_60734 [Piromyces sp. E2]|eukprot:OUM64312.1 hypothetical protein PIROE2DRAFT_60734 [Piromyces sp. E2]
MNFNNENPLESIDNTIKSSENNDNGTSINTESKNNNYSYFNNNDHDGDDGDIDGDGDGDDNFKVEDYVNTYIDNNDYEIDNGINEQNNIKVNRSNELFGFDDVVNPFDHHKPNDLIEKFFDLKNNNLSEMKSEQENSINTLKECLSVANSVTKKIKK